MAKITFTELSTQVQSHFANQSFEEGMILSSKHIQDFPEEFALINYWRICLAAQLNNFPLCSQLLDTTLKSELWYSETLLRDSPSLQAIQGDPKFEELVLISQKMQAADPNEQLPILVVRPENACGPEDQGCPTLLFLHGNQDSAQANLKHWYPLSNQGWLVALPQSSQAMWSDAYAWMSHESAKEEILARHKNLEHQYSLDTKETILAGFSMGGEVALALALREDIPTQGFILLGPGGPYLDNLDEWIPLLKHKRGKKLRGVIWMGLADETIPHKNIRALVEKLNQAEIETRLIEIPGLGHEYPPNFDTYLQEAINFILEGKE